MWYASWCDLLPERAHGSVQRYGVGEQKVVKKKVVKKKKKKK